MSAAPPFRRLGAALYDLMVVVALWMLAYFPLVAGGLLHGAAADGRDPRHWLLRGAIAFLYFGWCWTRGGRTLGLLAWRLAVVRADGAPLGWGDALRRFALACAYLLPLLALLALSPAPALGAYLAALLVPFVLGTLLAALRADGRSAHELPLATRAVLRGVA
jgi:uncharacterized RDD family membrane protein YckC